MIVLLNIEQQSLELYNEDGINKIFFSNIEEIYNYISPDQKVYYVTNATETNLEEIIKLVDSITGRQTTIINSNIKYLQSVSKGPLNISDPNAKADEDDVILRFINCYDLKIYDNNMEEKIKKYPILQNVIRSGKIKIINEIEKNKLLTQKRKENQKNKKKEGIKEKKEKSLIIDKPVADIADTMYDDMDDNIETIEVSEINANFKTETEQIMNQIGRR